MLFLSSTLAQYFARFGQEGDGGGMKYTYDFTLLSGAAGLMYGYTFVVPAVLWVVLRWFGSESANLLEAWCLYGYANLVWLPVAIASVSPITSESRSPMCGVAFSRVLWMGGCGVRRRRMGFG